jgi:hypothetical protein
MAQPAVLQPVDPTKKFNGEGAVVTPADFHADNVEKSRARGVVA